MVSDPITIERAELTAEVSRALIESLNAELTGSYPEPGATHFHLYPFYSGLASNSGILSDSTLNPIVPSAPLNANDHACHAHPTLKVQKRGSIGKKRKSAKC